MLSVHSYETVGDWEEGRKGEKGAGKTITDPLSESRGCPCSCSVLHTAT